MREHSHNHNPARSIGIFLIVFGLMMGAVIFDVLNLGDRSEYFKWQLLLIFIGLISFFNRNAIGGIIMVAVGTYFLLPEIDISLPYIFEQAYWPALIVIVGIAFLVSGIITRSRKY